MIAEIPIDIEVPADPRVWRYHVGRWPPQAIAKWHQFTIWYEDARGCDMWRAEYLAYLRVKAILDRAPEPPLVHLTTERPIAIDATPTSRVWNGATFRPAQPGEFARSFVPSPEDDQFIREWNSRASLLWDKQQEAARKKAQAAKQAAQKLMGPKMGPYVGERDAPSKRGRGKKRAPDPRNQTINWSDE